MSAYLIGIDVGGTAIKMMIMDTCFQVIGQTSVPTDAPGGYDAASERMLTALSGMFAERSIQNPEVLYAAMGLPGTVDRKAGKTVFLGNLHWDGFNPASKIGEYFSCPVIIDNDANIAAFGEYAFGTFRKSDLVLVTLGTGVGCGVVSGGQIFSGSHNMAAELGHMVITADGGPICSCGKRGHLESYCSGRALMRDALAAAAANPESILNRYIEKAEGMYDNSMVTRGALEGDDSCLEVISTYIHYLSVGLANVMSVYDPEIILLGGGISNAGELLIRPLNDLCDKIVLSKQSSRRIEIASLGADAGQYGACALAAQEAGLDLQRAGGY